MKYVFYTTYVLFGKSRSKMDEYIMTTIQIIGFVRLVIVFKLVVSFESGYIFFRDNLNIIFICLAPIMLIIWKILTTPQS